MFREELHPVGNLGAVLAGDEDDRSPAHAAEHLDC